MCDMPGVHTCKAECFAHADESNCSKNKETFTQEDTMSLENAASKIVEETKEVAIGAGIGLAYGGVVSTIVVVQSCVQIACYPLYMANCAVRPFVNLTTPLWFPAFTTFLGVCGGVAAKLSK